MNVTVVIATHGRSDFLKRTLQSLCTQSTDAFEVIVCNHGPSTSVTSTCLEFNNVLYLREVPLVRSGFNVAAPKNEAIQQARGGLVIVVDCGVICPPSFVRSHLNEHTKESVFVAGEVLGWDTEVATPFWHSIDPSRCPAKSRFPAACRDIRLDMLQHAGFAPWMLFWGCNFSVQQSALKAVGGFDASLIGWGWDDIELGYRLRRLGLGFCYSREAWAAHFPHPRMDLDVRLDQATRNWSRACEKHVDPKLEPWGVCEFQDIPETVARLTEICSEEARHVKPPCLAAGTAAWGFRCEAQSFLLESFKAPGLRTFGLRMPFGDGHFREIVIGPGLELLEFEASLGYKTLSSYVLAEAARISHKVRRS